MSEPLRVAYTLEQCWHRVPGGTAIATLSVAERLDRHPSVELLGVAGRHRHAPPPEFEPPIPVHALPLSRPALYESWNRWEWPPIERAVGAVDICHSTIAIPAATSAPHVVTVHDVAFLATPERFTRHGARVMRAGLERCRTADLVLCPSRATINDLVGAGFDSGRLRHVPWGVDPVAVSDSERERVRVAYALPDRFVLFVGTIEPRKNLSRLAAAMRRLDEPMPLVVVGADGWQQAPIAPDGVRFLGFVPRRDLAGIYRLATVFAYPSLQEGFGLPIVEAMTHGVPVVTSRGSSTEEVADGAAVLVDPTSIESIAVGIDSAIVDRAMWIDLGLERCQGLTWEATVDATVSAYREVAR